MMGGRQFVVCAMALALLLSVGCAQKPPQLPVQAQAPAEPIPTRLPPEITELSPPPPPAPAPKKETPPPEEPKAKPAQHRKRKQTQPPPVTTAQNNSGAESTNGAPNSNTTTAAAHPPGNPASEPPADTAIAAEVTSAQLSRQKQTTAQLLEETEKTLTNLNRPLSHDDESIVTQIRSYMTQSVTATKDGDFERAYNLATKAHLLSAALVKK